MSIEFSCSCTTRTRGISGSVCGRQERRRWSARSSLLYSSKVGHSHSPDPIIATAKGAGDIVFVVWFARCFVVPSFIPSTPTCKLSSKRAAPPLCSKRKKWLNRSS